MGKSVFFPREDRGASFSRNIMIIKRAKRDGRQWENKTERDTFGALVGHRGARVLFLVCFASRRSYLTLTIPHKPQVTSRLVSLLVVPHFLAPALKGGCRAAFRSFVRSVNLGAKINYSSGVANASFDSDVKKRRLTSVPDGHSSGRAFLRLAESLHCLFSHFSRHSVVSTKAATLFVFVVV